MNNKLKELAKQSGISFKPGTSFNANNEEYNFDDVFVDNPTVIDKFAKMIIEECLDKIETYRIPCGNSPAGEMACEWTYDALKTIRDDIKEHFGVE